MDEGLLNIISASCGQLVKKLVALEPFVIFGSKFAYFFILTLCSHWFAYADGGDDALSSIILASRGLLVKLFITLEPHHIF